MPDLVRGGGVSFDDRSDNLTGDPRLEPRLLLAGPVESGASSTMEFHSPQAVHFPAHWVVILPHCWQLYVAFLAIYLSRLFHR